MLHEHGASPTYTCRAGSQGRSSGNRVEERILTMNILQETRKRNCIREMTSEYVVCEVFVMPGVASVCDSDH